MQSGRKLGTRRFPHPSEGISDVKPAAPRNWDAAGCHAIGSDNRRDYSLAVSDPSLKPSTMPPNSTGGTSGAAERGVPVKVNGCSEPGSATSTTTISPG